MCGWQCCVLAAGRFIGSRQKRMVWSSRSSSDGGGRRWRSRLGCYVLAVGGIEPRKGSLDLIEAVASVRRRSPDVRLVIAGGDTLFDYRGYRAQVLARAEELAVALGVLGPVAHDELPSLVAAAGVFAFPSTREGFGPAAMEALAAGVPLVARDLPVLREVYDGAARFAREPDELAAALAAALLRPDPASGRPAAASPPGTPGRPPPTPTWSCTGRCAVEAEPRAPWRGQGVSDGYLWW